MNLYEVRDVVREHVGRGALNDATLNWCVERGLREIEKSGNFYWMEAIKSFSMVVDQQAYSIYTSTSGGLNIPNFKDSRILLISDQTLSNPDWDEVFGPEDIEDVKLMFSDTDEGMPVVWTKDEGNTDVTMRVWPPKPDKTYTLNLYYYQWTSLPTDPTTDDHEVLMRWPEALIYLGVEQGLILKTKDLAAGRQWRQMFDHPDRRQPDELKKIKRYHLERSQASRVELYPQSGPYNSRRKNWRRNKEIWL